ncbi:MAG: WD40 repeat domain-containing protein [Pseudanabaena sp. RU_4_16]|nr:WD40 repeat domain-containing protein [Pseudanabaena sp. RU_4_16]
MPKPQKQPILAPKPQWRTSLSEYVTDLAWHPHGQTLAAATAAGEIVLYDESAPVAQKLSVLHPPNDVSIDCLSFSANGAWLAAAGQEGKIHLWSVEKKESEQHEFAHVTTLEQGHDWIDRLVWHPTRAEFAFSLGKYVQVWNAERQDIVTTVNFDASSVLALNWHPSGDWLTVGGYQGIKMWSVADWDEDPVYFEMPTATGAIAWDARGKYLAANTIDKTVVLMPWVGKDFDTQPWRMQGFPGKIRAFAWSDVQEQAEPILVTTSGDEVVVWRKHSNPNIGWEGEVLRGHVGNVNLVMFQPHTSLLASAGEDGIVSLWQDAAVWNQSLDTSTSEITCLQWHPQLSKIAAGNAQGGLLVWHKFVKATGFGTRSV